MHVGERDELGEAAGLALQRTGTQHVPRPVLGLLDAAEHDRDVRAQADAVGDAMHLEPLLGVHLVGTQHGAHFVVEDLRRRARQRLQTGGHQALEVLLEADPRTTGALADLERGEAVDVDRLRRGAHGVDDVQVVVAVEVGMDAALQAHLGGAERFGFGHAARDLVELEQVRRAAQVERQRALGEGAELALERAHVRVVDVAVRHPGDLVAHDALAQLVGDGGDRGDVGAAGAEQRDDLVLADFLAFEHAGEHFGDRAAGVRRAGKQVRRFGVAAGAPRVEVAAEANGVAAAQHRRTHLRAPASAAGLRTNSG